MSSFGAELAQSPYMFKLFLGSLGIKLHKSKQFRKAALSPTTGRICATVNKQLKPTLALKTPTFAYSTSFVTRDGAQNTLLRASSYGISHHRVDRIIAGKRFEIFEVDVHLQTQTIRLFVLRPRKKNGRFEILPMSPCHAKALYEYTFPKTSNPNTCRAETAQYLQVLNSA